MNDLTALVLGMKKLFVKYIYIVSIYAVSVL